MIRGNKRNLPAEPVRNVDINTSIHNRFDIEVIDAKTGKVKQEARAFNIICKQLWTRLLGDSNYFNAIHYGSGTGTPSENDTSLFTYIAGSSSFLSSTGGSDFATGVRWYRRQIQLSPETAAGRTISEVGIGYGTGDGTICTHAMLEDMNGNPISINKSNTDIINIYATVYVHCPTPENSLGVWIPLNSLLVDCLLGVAPRGISYSVGNACFVCNTGSKTVSTACSVENKTMSLTVGRLNAADCNIVGGISSVILQSPYDLRPSIGFDITKTCWSGSDIIGETVGTGDGETVDFGTTFDFPTNAVVKVDGNVVDATVDNVPVCFNNMGQRFIWIGGVTSNFIGTANRYSDARISYWYNPNYEIGADSVYLLTVSPYGNYCSVYVYASDDYIDWVAIGSVSGSREGSATVNIPEAHQHKKYWKVSTSGRTGDRWAEGSAGQVTSNSLTGKNIHFSTPPAVGSVITIDYHTPNIAKDSNHVFDMTATIHLNEYTE